MLSGSLVKLIPYAGAPSVLSTQRKAAAINSLSKAIIAEEAGRTGAFAHDVASKRKLPAASKARRQVCVRLKAFGFSFPEIGRALDMHHSAVLRHVRKAQAVTVSVTQ